LIIPFTAINGDHLSMENPDCMNWEELSSCHRDMVGPIKESLGDQPRKGLTGVRFLGAIPVRSAYSLPQALVGLKQWTDPDIIFECDIFLGSDDHQALELAKNIQKQLCRYLRASPSTYGGQKATGVWRSILLCRK
jgi:hypothetical protein